MNKAPEHQVALGVHPCIAFIIFTLYTHITPVFLEAQNLWLLEMLMTIFFYFKYCRFVLVWMVKNAIQL